MAVHTAQYADQVRQLVKKHLRNRQNGKLLLAVWFDRDNDEGDVNLFEVFEDFPDPGVGRLETYLFSSSAQFPLKGSLRLTLTSPSELREAAERHDATLAHVAESTDKSVVYPAGKTWDNAIGELIG